MTPHGNRYTVSKGAASQGRKIQVIMTRLHITLAASLHASLQLA